MGEVLTTMIGRDDVARSASDSAECTNRAWCIIANAPFHETPGGLDRIEVVRVGRQEFQGGAALFDEEAHLRGLVRLQVVEQDDIAAARGGAAPT